MNKTQLTNHLADTLGVSKTRAKAIINAILSHIMEITLSSSRGSIHLKGFGKFKAQTGYSTGAFSLSDGARITLPGPVVKLAFRPDAELKKAGVSFRASSENRTIG